MQLEQLKTAFFPLLGSQCPDAHPYAYYNGEYCCATNREKSNSTIGDKCDGSIILNDSLCCKDDKYCKEESKHILKKKQNEQKQLFTLFFIIIIFIISNIPRVIISVHQVIIMEDIK